MKDLDIILKLALGSGYVKNYIKSPNETLIENDIAKAKATNEVASNLLYPVLEGIGTLLLQKGLSIQNKAYGGNINSGIPVEVEGDEVAKLPNELAILFQGPSHEKGGIRTALPEGTKVFSKRIKIEDKNGKFITMAELAEKREKKINKLKEKTKDFPFDKLLNNTFKRTKSNNDKEEKASLQLQELIGGLTDDKNLVDTNEKKLQRGTSYLKQNKLSEENNFYGDIPIDRIKSLIESGVIPYKINDKKVDYNTEEGIKTYQELLNRKLKKLYPKEKSIKTDGKFGEDTWGITQKVFLTPTKSINEIQPESIAPLNIDMLSTVYKDAKFELTKNNTNVDNMFNNKSEISLGDLLGLGSTLYSTFANRANTEANRAGDTPNINPFEHYGEEGLKTLDESKSVLQDIKDNALLELIGANNGMLSKNRNSARGINTMRALDLASQLGLNKGIAMLNDNFSKQLMNILTQQANMENQKDKVYMTGEQQRDLADRQDRDNYYTQRGQDITTTGEGLQHLAKLLNASKANKVAENAIKATSVYGFTYDNNGNILDKNGIPVSQEQLEIARKKHNKKNKTNLTLDEFIELIKQK